MQPYNISHTELFGAMYRQVFLLRVMQANVGEESLLHSFLTAELDGGE